MKLESIRNMARNVIVNLSKKKEEEILITYVANSLNNTINITRKNKIRVF